ncbi:hypothetical protein D3C83_16210 [compost metagenome]
MVLPSPTLPSSRSFSSPASEIADAGSQKMPSACASSFCTRRISSSVHSANQPPDSWLAATACCHDTGLPIRMAVATVSGFSTTRPRTIGAAPDAW